MKQDFIKYKDTKKLLADNGFFASIVGGKRGTRLTHTFWSISWYAIEYKVITLKVEGEWIVISITMNGEEIDGWENFISSIKNLHKLQNKARERLVKKVT